MFNRKRISMFLLTSIDKEMRAFYNVTDVKSERKSNRYFIRFDNYISIQAEIVVFFQEFSQGEVIVEL